MGEHGKANAFVRWYEGDHLRDTGHLTAQQDGAYRLLLGVYYSNGRPLPDRDDALARMARLTSAQWRKERPVLAAFFQVEGGVWRHKRCDREISYRTNKAELARSSAGARWQSGRSADAMRTHSAADADAERTQSGRNAIPEPEQEPESDGSPSSPVALDALVPSEADVLVFARGYQGSMALGIPPGIPDVWTLNWMSWRLSPGRPPLRDWRGEIVRKFQSDFAKRDSLALASPGAPAAKKSAALPAWRVQEDARAEWVQSALNPDSPQYLGDEAMTPELREQAEKMRAAAEG